MKRPTTAVGERRDVVHLVGVEMVVPVVVFVVMALLMPIVVTGVVLLAVVVSVFVLVPMFVARFQRAFPSGKVGDAVGVDGRKLRPNRFGVRLERGDERFGLRELRLATQVGFVQQDDVQRR